MAWFFTHSIKEKPKDNVRFIKYDYQKFLIDHNFFMMDDEYYQRYKEENKEENKKFIKPYLKSSGVSPRRQVNFNVNTSQLLT